MSYKHNWYLSIILIIIVTIFLIIGSLETCNDSLQSVFVAMISPVISLPIAIYSIYQTKINFINQTITNYKSMIISENATISKCKSEFTEIHTQLNIFIFNKRDIIANKYNVDTIAELYSISEGYMATFKDINNNVISSQNRLLRLLKLLKSCEKSITTKDTSLSKLFQNLNSSYNTYREDMNDLIGNKEFKTFTKKFENNKYNNNLSNKQIESLSGRILGIFSLNLQNIDNDLNSSINIFNKSNL